MVSEIYQAHWGNKMSIAPVYSQSQQPALFHYFYVLRKRGASIHLEGCPGKCALRRPGQPSCDVYGLSDTARRHPFLKFPFTTVTDFLFFFPVLKHARENFSSAFYRRELVSSLLTHAVFWRNKKEEAENETITVQQGSI